MQSGYYREVLAMLDKCLLLTASDAPADRWELDQRLTILRDSLKEHWESEEARAAITATFGSPPAPCQYPVG